MADPAIHLEPFARQLQAQVRALVLAGLAERWGTVDEELNHDLDDIAATYASGAVLVAVRDGVVVGAGAVVPRGRDSAEIVRVSVARTARRHGIGRMLVAALVEVARSWPVQRVVCETSSHWTSAVELYLRCGFVVDHDEVGAFGRDTWFTYSLR